MSRERRASPRFPLVLTVKYLDADSVLDYTENLSATGLFVRTDRVFVAGERTSLVVSFPQLLEPVELTVEVVRMHPREGDQPGGVAVRVPDDLPDHRAKLAEVTRFVANASRGPTPTCRILLCEDNGLVANMYAAALRRRPRPPTPRSPRSRTRSSWRSWRQCCTRSTAASSPGRRGSNPTARRCWCCR